MVNELYDLLTFFLYVGVEVCMNLRFEEEAKKEKRKKLIIGSVRYVIEIIIAIILAWLIVNLCLKKVTMIGSSMENTLSGGQEVIVNTFFKNFFSPGRNSVIAFYPERQSSSNSTLSDSNILIRRVVGLPGETVYIKDGYVYINDSVLEDSYEFDRNVSSGQAEQSIKLDEDEYFVLSDKRSDLDDSRSASFTKVKKDNILGTVFLALDPFSFVSGPSSEKEKEDVKEE